MTGSSNIKAVIEKAAAVATEKQAKQETQERREARTAFEEREGLRKHRSRDQARPWI